MEIPRWGEWVCEGARGPSTSHDLRIREVHASLRMTELDMSAQDDKIKESLHDRRIRTCGFVFFGVDFAVVFGVEGAMLGVEVLGRHGENETVFLAFEAGGVIPAVGIDHAFGEGAGVDQFVQRSREVVVLLLKAVLGTEYDAHVGESFRLGIRAGGVSGKFWFIS